MNGHDVKFMCAYRMGQANQSNMHGWEGEGAHLSFLNRSDFLFFLAAGCGCKTETPAHTDKARSLHKPGPGSRCQTW